MRRLARLLVAVVFLAGCGVPIDAEPRALDIAVEADVVDPATDADDLPVIAEVFLVTDGRLVSVNRQVADAEPETVLLALLRGPLVAETSLALRSAVPPETEVLSVDVSEGTARVDMSSAFTLVGGEEEILAVAQIVATLTSLEGIDGVRFSFEGEPRPAPVAEGELVDRPLTPEDFASLFTG